MDIESRSDIQLAGTAIREWDISAEQRAQIVETLLAIATGSDKERHKISAARELARMVATNVAARPAVVVSANAPSRKASIRDRIDRLMPPADEGDDDDDG